MLKLLSSINASKWCNKVEKYVGRGNIYLIFCRIASLIWTSEVISTLSIKQGEPTSDNELSDDVYFDIACINMFLIPKEDYCCDIMLFNRWINGYDIILFIPSDNSSSVSLEEEMKVYSKTTLLVGWLYGDKTVSEAISRAKRFYPPLYLDSKSQMKVQEKLENFSFLCNAHYPLLHSKLVHPYIFKVL